MTSPLLLNVPLILISSLGILFNGYIVSAVLLTRQVTTANNILLLHLGTVDVILGLIFLVFAVPNGYGKSGWMTEGFPCALHGFLHNLLHPLALWTICGLNCDRYYAIAAPLHYSHIVNAKKVLMGLGLGWLVCLVLCVPPLFAVAPYGYVLGLDACAPNYQIGGIRSFCYSTVYTIFTLLLPAALIVCCNLKILMIARYHRHRIASAIYEVTLSAQVTITHQRNPFFVPSVTAPTSGGPPKFRGRSAIYTVLQLVGSLAILYIPYYSLILWQSIHATFSNTAAPTLLATVSTLLLIVSPSINAFLYGVKNKQLRKTFKNYWRKKQTKSEVNQEIQARTPSTCGSRRPSLTPLGFLTSKPAPLQRRLSEAYLDNRGSPQKHKIKRITTELTWRPSASASSLNFITANAVAEIRADKMEMKQTTSCNTLQVPQNDADAVKSAVPSTRLVTANSLLLKFFEKPSQVVKNVAESKRKSPRITITRTCSEESGSEASRMTRKLSSTSLVERRRQNSNFDRQVLPMATEQSSCFDDTSSDLSDESGKIFMTLDRETNDDEDEEEEGIMLTWSQNSYSVINDSCSEDDKPIGLIDRK